MKLLSKVSSRISRSLFAFVLATSSLVPATIFIAPAAVSAAACSAAGGGGGGSLLSLIAESPQADSTVDKIGFEVTPAENWGDATDSQGSYLSFADSSCAYNSSNLYYNVAPDNTLSFTYVDNTRTGAFVDGTDYDNAYTGVTVNSLSNIMASAEYVVTGYTASTPLLVSVDLSNTGWIDVYLKIGAASEIRLVSFLAVADTTSFHFIGSSGYQLNYGYYDDLGNCDGFTGSRSVEARVLFDGAAQDLTTSASGTCSSFGANSYDSGTKTATLGYTVDGVAVQHTVDLVGDSGGIKAATVDSPVFVTSSLALTGDNKNFAGSLTSSSSSSQQLYFNVTESVDGKKLPKDTPWPIAGGVFDMSAGDVDLSTVVLDTSLEAHSAVAHNFSTKTKDGSFTLFVPYKDGDNFVGVCAGAADLAAVSNKCTGVYYVKDGQTKTNTNTKSIPDGASVKASIITVGATKFWQVDGLTGSGAFSAVLASDPDTGISSSAAGLPAILAVTALTIGAALLARRATVKVKK